MIHWQEIFSKAAQKGRGAASPDASNLEELKAFLDMAHIRHCLVKPYQEQPNYPLVESRELLPTFENPMYEYHELPGFSMVALGRGMDYFSEIFQFDKLHRAAKRSEAVCPVKNQHCFQNINTVASRLPKQLQEELRGGLSGKDVTKLEHYCEVLPFLLEMDRAHVLALDSENMFHLAGIFASFPSDIDSELKRFGLRIGKFVYGDSEMYERNRMFVYQYLMELYGFPVVSERRTSSALFARKLHKMGESFLLRVLGQSDRTLTTYISDGENRRYPRVEKIALVGVDRDQEDVIETIARKGFFLDENRRVVIMRICYRQHRYNPGNLRQDRALSVASQEVLHPLTGEPLGGLNIIKDGSNMFLRLNDIVRGEYNGRIVYKRTEIVENTDTDEKRLKFLYSWLVKHQRRMISYNDEFFDNVNKVLNGYLKNPDKAEAFDTMRELYQEVLSRISYIHQARRVRILQDVVQRLHKGRRIGYREMSEEAVKLLTQLQFELVNFFPELVDSAIKSVDTILHDRYLIRTYITPPEHALTDSGKEIRKNYSRLVSILDSIQAVRKSRLGNEPKQEPVTE